MTTYLLDTNVVMRFCNPSDVRHQLATDAISHLLMRSDECLLANEITHLLTFNPSDFAGVPSITITHPQDLKPLETNEP